MVKYESLLLGGKARKSSCKKEESSSSESEEEEMMGEGQKKKGGLTYEQRCANLAKGRATRMANLAKKKKMGKGNYTQDYVPESQINYAGSPLDIYYKKPEKQRLEELRERGENEGKGMRKKKSKGISDDMIEMGQTGGKHIKGGEMSFMKESMHTGMSMPTKEQFKTGGKMKKAKMPEHQLDISGAIENLARLAEKFGLRLV
tara:strand:- start:409 stop:1017 length:609 start_codon:yes stop_codon:yes gene_type:complete